MTTVVRLEDAQRHVWERVGLLNPVLVNAAEAIGLTLAEAIVASEDVPPFPNSSVDGWAVRAADTSGAPCELQILGEVAAGSVANAEVVAGGAIKIMTGAPIPNGANAVVMVEDSAQG